MLGQAIVLPEYRPETLRIRQRPKAAARLLQYASFLLQADNGWKPSSVEMQEVAERRRQTIQLSFRAPLGSAIRVPNDLTFHSRLSAGYYQLYGLDIWTRERKVLNLHWQAGGRAEVLSFHAVSGSRF